MEKFRKTIEHRRLTQIAFVMIVLVISVAGIFTSYLYPLEMLIPDYVLGFSGGLSLAVAFLLIRSVAKYTKALQSEEILKELYIEETDERNVTIRTKTGGTAINIILGTLICAALVGGIFNEIVFYTLFATLLFVSSVILILKFYYKKKL